MKRIPFLSALLILPVILCAAAGAHAADAVPLEPDHHVTVEAVETDAAADLDEASEAIPVWQFCHGVREGLETAVIRGYETDCEEGPREIEMTAEEIEEIRGIAIGGVITGQANDLSVTGGTWLYTFETPEGEHLLTIELYQGLIVDSATGMYHYSK